MVKTHSPSLQARAILELRRRGVTGETEISNELPDIADWIEQNFWIPELSGPIQLADYQKAVLREAFTKNPDGKFKYSLVIWGDIKKSIKSCIAAARALYTAWYTPWGSVKIVANDLKQADSRVAYYVRRAITLNPAMKDIVKQVTYKTTFPNRATIEAIPIDPAGEAGGNDDLIIFSELWAAKHKAIQQMWSEMTLSPTKFGYSQRWVETYAGYNGESPLLEQLYQTCVKDENRLVLNDDLIDLELYASGSLLCLWNTRPRLSWQTDEYYNSEQQVLTPAEFERVHRNRWTSSVEKFVDMTWWGNCQEPLPALTKDEPIIIALDANKGSETTTPADCFAMVAVSRHPSRHNDVAVRYCGIWQAPKGQLMDYAPVVVELRRLCSTFTVIEVAYDPTQLAYLCSELKKEGVALFKEFGQDKPRLLSDKMLRDLIIGKRIAHDGNPILREHIDNSNIKNHGEDGIRIIKRQQDKKIDACVALAMAANRCLYYSI